jgi:integrase
VNRKIASGSVFKNSYGDKHGVTHQSAVWSIKYYVNGKARVETAGTQDYDEAKAFLRRRMNEAESMAEYSAHPERVKMSQLFDLLIEDYKFNQKKSAYDTELCVQARLRPFFGALKASAVGTAILKQYIENRQRQEMAPATINRELALVRRAMNLGFQHEPPLVLRVPHFPMFALDNARQGVIEDTHYRLIRDGLPPYARIATVIGYFTGARRGEITSFRTEWVDMQALRINLPGRVTKNYRFPAT